ncbi:hypothetical protein SDC9_19569 [bioreactor metagenome]|uniref:Uncharacterized protein n=1 Tax=bioreactor metagenome TaxID=1076179 RepID=A0A644U4C2_9ZZZZ
MGGRHAKLGGIVRHAMTRTEFALEQCRIARHQLARGIGGGQVVRARGRLPLEPDAEQAKVVMDGAIGRRPVAFAFALRRLEQGVQLDLRGGIADAQMQRALRQRQIAVGTEEDCRAMRLRAHVETVHHARRDEDRVMRAIAAGGAADGDPPLAAGEPQQAGLGQRAHRLDPPAPALGKPGDRHQAQLRGRRGQAGGLPVARRLAGGGTGQM